MSNRSKPTKGRRKPATLPPPDFDNIPPLIPIRDCYTDRRRGKIGYTPLSESALRERIRAGKIEVVKLGPRLTCLTRKTVQHIQRYGLPAA